MINGKLQTRTGLLRQGNTRAVLAALQQHGPLSRADLTRHTGISSPTVTRTVSALLEANLLEEGESQPRVLGRPGRILRLAGRGASIIGVAVGVHQCEIVQAGLDGDLLGAARTFATPTRYSDLVRRLIEQIGRLIDGSETSNLGVGISIPGLLNRREKRTVISPNLHQLDGQRLGEDARRQLGQEVALIQESRALCLAERTYGAARGLSDFAMLDVTDGLGLGVVQGGQLVEGHGGLAGELGHITVDLHGRRCGCGNYGCLETVATDAALATALSERLGRRVTLEEVLPALQAGTISAEPELERTLDYLAVALAAVINIFNPSKLFVYGRMLDAAPDVFARLLERTRRRALAPSFADCELVRARGDKRLGAIAGIIHRLTTGRDVP